MLQPVDTWVRQVAVKLKIISKKAADPIIIQAKIVKACEKCNVSSLLFNAGAWYISSNALDVILEILE